MDYSDIKTDIKSKVWSFSDYLRLSLSKKIGWIIYYLGKLNQQDISFKNPTTLAKDIYELNVKLCYVYHASANFQRDIFFPRYDYWSSDCETLYTALYDLYRHLQRKTFEEVLDCKEVSKVIKSIEDYMITFKYYIPKIKEYTKEV